MRFRRNAAKGLEQTGRDMGLSIPLVEATREDCLEARAVMSEYQIGVPNRAWRSNKRALMEVGASSVFGASSVAHMKDLAPAMVASSIPALAAASQAIQRQQLDKEAAAPPQVQATLRRKRARCQKALLPASRSPAPPQTTASSLDLLGGMYGSSGEGDSD